MSFVNYAAREITLKIVYYGAGLSGKTTNVRQLHAGTAAERRGKLVELSTDEERTLMFDFAPLAIGEIHGFRLRTHIYSVPGQIFYQATRRLIVRGADAIVFVADSQEARMEANEVALEHLDADVCEHFGDSRSVPCVMQYNKRDVPEATPLAQLQRALNRQGWPEFEGVASLGIGVQTTAKAAIKLAVRGLQREFGAASEARP
jgi:signal recognition particle receptor subunit beta